MSRLERSDRRRAVAAFVRDRRAKIRPEDVGLAPGARRRTPGLRREEVAQLAGVGVTWYTWFEQGRDIQVSTDFLERLCRAFRLNVAERNHLFTLAQHRPPPHGPRRDVEVPDAARAVLQSLPTPAYVKTTRWDIVAWNAAARDTLGDFAQVPPEERNILWLVFTADRYRRLMVDWEADARRSLEKFRIDYARADGDPNFEALVEDLQGRSAEFRQWWQRQDVCGLGEGVKRLRHPRRGVLEFDHAVFSVEGPSDVRLVVYTPHTTGPR